MTNTFKNTIAATIALGTMAIAGQAGAVSLSVQYACMGDYFKYCSSHDVGSSSLRRCMSNAGPKLSKRCVNALVSAGEVSRKEVNRRSARKSASRRGR